MKHKMYINKLETIVNIDKALDKLSKKILFKDKLDNANKVLKTVGLPKSHTN